MRPLPSSLHRSFLQRTIRPAGEIYKRFAYQSMVTAPIVSLLGTVSRTNGRYAADKVLILSTIDQKDVADNLYGSSECSSILA